ncbi:MAG: hypothetical protein GC180_08875 [Bacteroidetes bacterium]|nr:hypothetical protein [Bacteroidota bacterium]
MRLTREVVRKNRVKLMLIALLLGNIALYHLTATVFNQNKKAENQQKRNDKTSYFQRGIQILHLGSAVIDYFGLLGEQDER